MNTQKEGYKIIALLFKEFKKQINLLWEIYNLNEFSLTQLHKLLKNKKISEDFELESLISENRKKVQVKNIYGIIQSIVLKRNPNSTLLESVAVFEDYIQKVIYYVYKDFPLSLLTGGNDKEDEEREVKLLNLIIKSDTKEEMIEILIEEKIRGIFYGKPSDIFLKKKGNIDLNNAFDKYKDIIKSYTEITARRNIIVHNNSKVDRKYQKEVSNTTYKLDQTVKVEKKYLKESIVTLKQIAAIYTVAVFENIYKVNVKGKVIGGIYQNIKRP